MALSHRTAIIQASILSDHISLTNARAIPETSVAAGMLRRSLAKGATEWLARTVALPVHLDLRNEKCAPAMNFDDLTTWITG